MPSGLILLAAFILLPTIEIFFFVEVGSAIGAIPTILLTVATAAAGTFLLRYQGISLLTKMRAEMEAGRVPGDDLMHGALMVFAAIMLLIPGFFTDAIGLLLFVPPIRSAIARFIAARVDVRSVNINTGGPRTSSKDGVVDLDETEWSTAGPQDDTTPHNSDPHRISPWNEPRKD